MMSKTKTGSQSTPSHREVQRWLYITDQGSVVRSRVGHHSNIHVQSLQSHPGSVITVNPGSVVTVTSSQSVTSSFSCHSQSRVSHQSHPGSVVTVNPGSAVTVTPRVSRHSHIQGQLSVTPRVSRHSHTQGQCWDEGQRTAGFCWLQLSQKVCDIRTTHCYDFLASRRQEVRRIEVRRIRSVCMLL